MQRSSSSQLPSVERVKVHVRRQCATLAPLDSGGLRRRWLAALLVVATCVVGSGCAVNPVTGEKDFILIPEAQDLAIGEQQYVPTQQIQGGQYRVDSDLTEYVASVGRRLAKVSDVPELPYEFVVINDSTPNAWALPGGKIAINRGLLVELGSEAELAAVLGHEIVHAAARHGAQSLSKGTLLQGGLALGSVLVPDSPYRNLALAGAQVGAQLVSSKYGRDAERESDAYGMEYMKRAGYDPVAAVALQETFVRLSDGRRQDFLSGYFASHPPSAERVENNRQKAAALGRGGEMGVERYQRAIAYIKSKQSAYKDYASAQAALAKGKLDEASRLAQSALSKEDREALFYGLRGNVSYLRKDFDSAYRDYDRAVTLNPVHYDLLLGRGLSALRLNRAAEGRRDLEASQKLLPTALAANELGKLSLQAGQVNEARQLFASAAQAAGPIGAEARAYAARIDLRVAPGRLFQTAVGLTEDGQLVGQVANASDLRLRNIVVEFRVQQASGVARVQRRISVLEPQQAVRLAAGVAGSPGAPAELVVLAAEAADR